MYESYVQLLPAITLATHNSIEQHVVQYAKTLSEIAQVADVFKERVSILRESFSINYIEEINEIFIHDVWGVEVNTQPIRMILIHHFDKSGQYEISGEFSLQLHVYSDMPTQEEYKKLKKVNPEASDFGETTWIFDGSSLIKLIRIPSAIDPKRPVITKSKLFSVAHAKVTAEDLTIIQKALTMFLEKVKKCEEVMSVAKKKA